MLPTNPPTLFPPPPDIPVRVENGQPRRGFSIIASGGRQGQMIDWQCAAGQMGHSPVWGAQYSLIHESNRWTADGFISDVNVDSRPQDAYGRLINADGSFFIPTYRDPVTKEMKTEKYWSAIAACDPVPCPPATPAPPPVPATPPPPSASECAAAIAKNGHFLVGGGGAHAWHPIDGGLVRVVADTTWRPICDTDHIENWNNPDICGKCSHDPDYTVPEGAQIWTVEGAEDRGWNPGNSAQRIIIGRPGARVKITICPARPVIAAATGTELPIGHGDGCARPDTWTLPGN